MGSREWGSGLGLYPGSRVIARRFLQSVQFLFCQGAGFAFGQISQFYRADACAAEPGGVQVEVGKYPADLPVFSFYQHNAKLS